MKALPTEILNETVRLRNEGKSLKEIANAQGLTSTNGVNRRLRQAGWKGFERTCELIDCGKKYVTRHSAQRCCCREHLKRLQRREQVGIEARFAKCLLPECDQMTLVRGKQSLFCCEKHWDTHWKRVRSGFYERILGRAPPCVVCGEKLLTEEHHVEHEGVNGPSNKDGPTVWLCPTHHMAIHRSVAVFVDGVFTWVHEKIKDGLLEKHVDLVNGGGKTWADKP